MLSLPGELALTDCCLTGQGRDLCCMQRARRDHVSYLYPETVRFPFHGRSRTRWSLAKDDTFAYASADTNPWTVPNNRRADLLSVLLSHHLTNMVRIALGAKFGPRQADSSCHIQPSSLTSDSPCVTNYVCRSRCFRDTRI
jgi:hypothetical protein